MGRRENCDRCLKRGSNTFFFQTPLLSFFRRNRLADGHANFFRTRKSLSLYLKHGPTLPLSKRKKSFHDIFCEDPLLRVIRPPTMKEKALVLSQQLKTFAFQLPNLKIAFLLTNFWNLQPSGNPVHFIVLQATLNLERVKNRLGVAQWRLSKCGRLRPSSSDCVICFLVAGSHFLLPSSFPVYYSIPRASLLLICQ